MDRNDPKVERLILRYWRQHKTIAAILACLRLVHHVSVGLTWLKRKLSELGLKRRGQQETPLQQLVESIKVELKTSNCLLGYRAMWRLLQSKYGYIVKRSTVMMLLAVMDPDGTIQRKKQGLKRTYTNKGPNWCWHIDGYDKLKPYGFPIHGCIDGYSGKILWLDMSTTDNDPAVVVKYYLDTVLKLQGCPAQMRGDRGNENSSIAACQMFFRHQHDDRYAGSNSFIFGSSIKNTRIESLLSRLRSFNVHWWIDLFKGLIEEGLYDPSLVMDKHLAAYIFGGVLTKELHEFKSRWNRHRIIGNNPSCPCDAPNDLYNLRLVRNLGEDFLQDVDPDHLAYCYVTEPHPLYPDEFQKLADHILSDLNITQDQITADNCKLLYCFCAYQLSQL